MEILKKYSILSLLAAACLFSSCEEEFDVKVEDTSPRIFLQGMVSPFSSSPIYVYKAVSVGGTRSDAHKYTLRDVSLKVNGTEVGLAEEGYLGLPVSEGGKRRFYLADDL